MMRWISTCLLALLCACGGDEKPFGFGLDAALTTPLDAEVTRAHDAGSPPDGAPPTLVGASSATCSADPLPLLVDCSAADPARPSSAHAPARLSLEPSCGFVQAWAADRSEDVYRFTPAKSDPVQITLHYRAAAPAALAMSLVDEQARTLSHGSATSTASDQTLQLTYRLLLGSAYDLSIEPTRVGTCLPYSLRVDPHWCTDAREDDDDAAHASTLVASQGVMHVEGTLAEGDGDYFQFRADKSDPVQWRGSYSVPDGGSLQLERQLASSTGLASVRAAGARVGSSESFAHWLMPNQAGATILASLAGSGSGCASYTLDFDVGACTDALEDNDDPSHASPLPAGSSVQGSVFTGDDDYYALTGFAGGGTCTLQWAPSSSASQPPKVTVSSASGTPIASATGGETSALRTVHWSGAATLLAISAAAGDACQTYTLRCDATSQ